MTKLNEITDERLDDWKVAAFEGGINYWCENAKAHDTKAYPERYYTGNWTLRTVDGETFLLTDESLRKGIRRAFDHYTVRSGVVGRLVDLWEDFIEFQSSDAGDADNAVQFAVFGELIYG